jgi:hypothetical protein
MGFPQVYNTLTQSTFHISPKMDTTLLLVDGGLNEVP